MDIPHVRTGRAEDILVISGKRVDWQDFPHILGQVKLVPWENETALSNNVVCRAVPSLGICNMLCVVRPTPQLPRIW